MRLILILMALLLTLLVGCQRCDNSDNRRLNKSSALLIANKHCQKSTADFQKDEYAITVEYMGARRIWSVYYVKQKGPVGSHFEVEVSDATGQSRILRGK